MKDSDLTPCGLATGMSAFLGGVVAATLAGTLAAYGMQSDSTLINTPARGAILGLTLGTVISGGAMVLVGNKACK